MKTEILTPNISKILFIMSFVNKPYLDKIENRTEEVVIDESENGEVR